jgi:hypothetical protein
MGTEQQYMLDADVFITAKNRYYAFRICPGFWASVIHHHRAGRLFSIDRVRNELLVGRKTEDLVLWVTNDLPDTFFLGVDDDAVTTMYTEVMMFVQRSPQYFDYAKAKFATGADGWLVAYAKVHGAIVVTNEERRPEARREIKLPDVCDNFDVPYTDTFRMLENLAVRFDFEGGP